MAFPKLTVLQMKCWNLLPWGCWPSTACEQLWEAWSCHSLVALLSRLLLPSVLWAHDSLLYHRCSMQAVAEGKSQAVGSRDVWMEVPSVLESSWEPVCGPRALAGLALRLLRLPATCGPDVVRGEVQPWSRDLLGFKEQPPPPAIPPLLLSFPT